MMCDGECGGDGTNNCSCGHASGLHSATTATATPVKAVPAVQKAASVEEPAAVEEAGAAVPAESSSSMAVCMMCDGPCGGDGTDNCACGHGSGLHTKR
jgi:hypothetical protein